MVVRKDKKFRRFRGFRSYGFGSHKKHRGGGSRGGRGQAGLHKHKWSYTVKYDKEHFGKHGFTRPPETVEIIKAVNVSDIDRKVEQFLKDKTAVEEGGKIKIDVSKIGYDKVLGSGRIKHAMIVEAKYFSKSAIKKIEEAGGKAVAKPKAKAEMQQKVAKAEAKTEKIGPKTRPEAEAKPKFVKAKPRTAKAKPEKKA